MDKELKELLEQNAIDVDKEINKILPKEFDTAWFNSIFNKTDYEYDCQSCTKAIAKPIWDLLERGGKRWRPLLMKLSYFIVGGKNEQLINKFSVIPELIHNGTLIIDDIEDCSELRRGKPCIHKIFGNDIAINAGNALYYFPLLTLIKDESLNSETKAKLYEIINEEMIKISFGQAMDIYWHRQIPVADLCEGTAQNFGMIQNTHTHKCFEHNNNIIPTEKQYLQMCAYKTGTLARMSAKLGAILGNGTESQINALGKFAESIGVAFQIQDDILNITNKEWGKDFGDDISEGKKSLIVIKTLEQANEADKKRLIEILNKKTKDKELINEAIEIIKKYSGIKDSKKVAEELVSKAWKELDLIFPESYSKNKLRLFANFMIEREI